MARVRRRGDILQGTRRGCGERERESRGGKGRREGWQHDLEVAGERRTTPASCGSSPAAARIGDI